MLLTIIFVIVCDLPVPGGPCRTKEPLNEEAIASYCEESALMGRYIPSLSIYASSEVNVSSEEQLHSGSRLFPIRERIRGDSFILSI